MQLRQGDGWQPVYERLALHWIDRGCGREDNLLPRSSERIRRAQRALERSVPHGESSTAEVDGDEELF